MCAGCGGDVELLKQLLDHGSGVARRLCEYTNYCEALDQKHVSVTCKLPGMTPSPASPTIESVRTDGGEDG